jgi:hypothetical protein
MRMIPTTIQLGFEPKNVTDAGLKKVIADPLAWAIWLLWRPCHIVSQHFNENVLRSANHIRTAKPQSMREYVACFHGCDFPRNDVDAWISQSYPFLVGLDKIRIEVKSAAPKSDISHLNQVASSTAPHLTENNP